MKQFALIGASGFIAPRHMKAILDTGNTLAVVVDPKDSVGIVDSYFPSALYFDTFEQFDFDIDQRRRRGHPIDYVSVASPNYLHKAHIGHGLRSGAHVICEKPLVLEPAEIDELEEIEAACGRTVNTILQLRLHPMIMQLHKRYSGRAMDCKVDVDLTYITARGQWFGKSWKGVIGKSGGIATNIGVHFFDMLHFIFGAVLENTVHLSEPAYAAGYLEFENARVRWFLSVDANHLPESIRSRGQRTYRSITLDGEEVEFSGGFADLHTRCYEQVLSGKGFGLSENRVAIETVASIRRAQAQPLDSRAHSLARALKQ